MAISPSPPPSSAPFLVQPFPPPPQPQGTTRFVLISDTHGHPPPASLMPEGDVLIHAGDLGRWGRQDVLDGAIGWLEALPYPVKLVIAGNHDSLLDPSLPAYHAPPASSVSKNRSRLLGPSARKANIHYLEYTSFTFRARPSGREWTVWGSPGSPAYGSPAFQYTSQQAEGVYASLPPGVDILLTHSPPLGPTPLDQTSRGVHAGCKVLARKVRELEVGPWLHVFGHIHEGWGWTVRGPEEVRREREEEAASGLQRARKRNAKRPSAELPERMDALALTSASSHPPARDRWRLSVNAALGRMGANGSTSKGVRAPIVVDFWEERMDGHVVDRLGQPFGEESGDQAGEGKDLPGELGPAGQEERAEQGQQKVWKSRSVLEERAQEHGRGRSWGKDAVREPGGGGAHEMSAVGV